MPSDVIELSDSRADIRAKSYVNGTLISARPSVPNASARLRKVTNGKRQKSAAGNR